MPEFRRLAEAHVTPELTRLLAGILIGTGLVLILAVLVYDIATATVDLSTTFSWAACGALLMLIGGKIYR